MTGRLEGLKDIINKDGSVGISNEIQGKILQESSFGAIHFYEVEKHCPYCPKGITQPVKQIVIYKGMNNVMYHCPTCCVEYYYMQNKVYRMRSEFEFIHKGYLPAGPYRLPYELHYMEARDCHWYLNQDLKNTDKIEGLWTMFTEVCAQIFHKKMSGVAPAYFLCKSLVDESQIKIEGEYAPIFLEAHKRVQQLNYLQ